MVKNIKLLFCILGSTFLVLLKTPVFKSALYLIYHGTGHVGALLGHVLNFISDIMSFIGFILVVIFSVLLIIQNLDFKNK